MPHWRRSFVVGLGENFSLELWGVTAVKGRTGLEGTVTSQLTASSIPWCFLCYYVLGEEGVVSASGEGDSPQRVTGGCSETC